MLVDEELKKIKLKMKALGFTQQQIESIIEEASSGRCWDEMSEPEKQQILRSINERITFARKILQFLNCKTCYR